MTDKTDEKISQLKEATREANLVLADFKKTIRDGRVLLADIDKMVAEQVDSTIAAHVEKGLANLGVATATAIKNTEDGIYARFDQIVATLMGEDKHGRPAKGMSNTIPQLIAQLPYCTVHEERHGPAQVQISCVFEEQKR